MKCTEQDVTLCSLLCKLLHYWCHVEMVVDDGGAGGEGIDGTCAVVQISR
jgi:hypothetical protein